jgi:hypothetical protein
MGVPPKLVNTPYFTDRTFDYIVCLIIRKLSVRAGLYIRFILIVIATKAVI